jgi:uncharacterized protein (TIGR03492 family)
MTDLANVLIVSNGHGEAAISGYIAEAIRARNARASVEHLPLVGSASDLGWPPTVGPTRAMPSGGLVTNWNVRNFAGDVRAGLLRLFAEQHRFLRKQAKRGVVVAVGDVFCLWMSLASRRPVVFVATAKSDYVSPHSAIERRIMRKAAAAFVRDPMTARSLQHHRVPARYAGNLMMDGIIPSGVDLGVDGSAVRLGVLPGSRADAPRVCAAMYARVLAVSRLLRPRNRQVQAFFSIAPGVDPAQVIESLRSAGAVIHETARDATVIGRSNDDSLEMVMAANAFGDVLAASQIILGQAGTANEQAAGFGRPVIAALEPGETAERMQWYRMRQKRLLGDALLVVPPQPDAFAREVVALMDDSERQAAMSRAGKERMGAAGGSAAVADSVLTLTKSGA